MSGPAGAAPPTVVLGLGLDVSGRWHQRAVQKSRDLVQTYLLSSSVRPPPTAGGAWGTRAPVRLPSLVATAKGPRRRSSMARLSLSEPSLFTPNDNILFEGFSSSRRRSVLQKRPPPPPPFSKSSVPLPCKTCLPFGTSQTHQNQVQSSSRPAYIHFSQAIQPGSKPKPVRRHSHNPALSAETVQGDLRPSVVQYRNSPSQGEPLSVVGKPCLPSCGERPALAAGPGRTQLHVFLPTEAEGEEVDSESVDEGFMDELDSKITSLKLQQGAPKTLTYH
ncbi:uncharacterized protein LOC121958132 [Plectropomus leopardus]|uniref:uncharacterized protein LOC121958132 n=1 Tax=Plectropomus leopardus TaxID=160734 RepID=UPI001C4D4779|nr:uncharacterized protein LOC121958132 [Plectropomus leopardus]